MKKYVVISNNCWGSELYKKYNWEYNSPFIGLFLYSPDYLKLLKDFDNYLSYPILFIKESKWRENIDYPLGLLNDIEVHFMHYHSEEEAKNKWDRRLERMRSVCDKDNYIFKICDRDGGTSEIITEFHKLPYKNKISFGLNDLPIKNHFKISEEKDGSVTDGVTLFNLTSHLVEEIFFAPYSWTPETGDMTFYLKGIGNK